MYLVQYSSRDDGGGVIGVYASEERAVEAAEAWNESGDEWGVFQYYVTEREVEL